MEPVNQASEDEVRRRMTEALQKCEAILKKYEIDQPIPDGDDLEYVKGVLNAHQRLS